MRSKFVQIFRRRKQDKFQFELLEPRHLFSVSDGTIPPLVEPMDISIEHHSDITAGTSDDVGFGTQVDQALVNFLYLPLINVATNASVTALTPLQLSAEVFVNVESDLTLQWTKVSGPGNATFSDSSSANSTVQFDQAGSYLLQLAATNHGTTALSQVLVTVTSGLPDGVLLYRPNEMQFAGNDDHIVLPHDDDYLLNNGTVAFWFNADNIATKQGLFSKDSSSYDTGGHLTFHLENGQINVRLQSTNTSYNLTSGAAVSADTWHHVAFSFGSGGMKLYLDGTLRDSGSYTGGLGTSSGGAGNYEPIVLGADSGISGNLVPTPVEYPFLGGSLDDVIIVDHALTAPEITGLVDGGHGATTPAPPTAANSSIIAPKNGTINGSVSATDPNGDSLTYALVSSVLHGQLVFNANGTYTYTPATGYVGGDSFSFRANDGTQNSNVATVTITVQATNSEEQLTKNLPLGVNEGATGTITSALLQATDADNTPAQLTYTVTAGPSNGSLRKSGAATTSFTQADINAGLITYQHNGGESTSDSFSFTVNDGQGTSTSATFSIAVTPVNDEQTLTTNTGLSLQTGTTGTIGSSQLRTSDSDNTAAQLVYTVTSGPTKGTLRKSGVATTSFTQSDIDSGLITYQHNGGTSTSDSFSFTVNDGQGTTTSGTFAIAITPIGQNTINIDQAWLNARGDGPYYLDQAGKTYVLQTDVTTDGTAFAIIAENVTFDLNGHTITYNNATPITIPNGSFEQGSGTSATGWNFSNAPNASRHQGNWLHNEVYDGTYSLKFGDTKTNQYVTSTSTITLEANTTYSLSAMFEYGGQGTASGVGVKGYVRLVASGLTTREVSHTSGNNRGIQLREGVFTTGDTPETYQIQVGIEGQANATVPFYIDDIKIQRTGTHGVVVSPRSYTLDNYPDITQTGVATNAKITGGIIVQGTDGATWGHGIYVHTTDGVRIENLNITVHGANSSAIYGEDQGTYTSVVSGNTLTSNVKTISSRDNFHGAVIRRMQGEIFNNTITNGVHSGIVAANGTSTNRVASNIYSNTISLQSKYTNGFAIIASYGSQIHDNIVNCGTGSYAARGILVSSGNDSGPTTKVYNNTVRVQEHANNQEYEGEQLGGGYAIQLENAKNLEVYNNDATAYGTESPGYAFRMNSDNGTSAAVSVHNNIFRAIAGNSHAAAVKFTRVDAGMLTFEDNELITNDGIVGTTRLSTVTLLRSKITVDAPIADPYVFESWYEPDPGLHTSISLRDTTFTNSASKTYVNNAIVRSAATYGGAPDGKMAFDLSWTTTVTVKDLGGAALPDASVTIKDSNNTVVATGVTDGNGKYTAVLTQLRTQGDSKTSYNPFTVTATIAGEQVVQQLVVDAVKSLNLELPITVSGQILSSPDIMDLSSTVLMYSKINDDEVGSANSWSTQPQAIEFDVDEEPDLEGKLRQHRHIRNDTLDSLIVQHLPGIDKYSDSVYLESLDLGFDDLEQEHWVTNSCHTTNLT